MESIIKAIILGIIQGLTEFLPVSSSGHLEIAKELLNVSDETSLRFTVIVHGGTVLSTIFVFYKEILNILKGAFQFKWNSQTQYIFKIAISMIPIFVVGIFFKDTIEEFFFGDLTKVGIALLFTAGLLAFTYYAKNKEKDVSYLDAFVIGISQAIAVIPGISRSGSTIATALILGVKKEVATQFSFLMVLVPIIGANLLDIIKSSGEAASEVGGFSNAGLLAGFIASFVTGVLACKLMINIVKKGKLIYFAIYCGIVGTIAIVSSLV
ncbi:undecaprenyl-diphosphate phosphatase [Aureibacter tunicatorum]|uniref:Undecaprenyl-diphosphatase n=1 Tax=Aureibacter tunicatorum TaxID=866807 RepID=A0AAE3XNJ5_9BACT|nr:undecaprenyl-diphosphate phosphatase [Aureibacter tunicatorum]MDR6239853.1 undecaprenyl-diphosphatase [Aureibacter tunicatorum]BDD04328.1 undecaprenyl-diphosphatase [Aureibacter tunicatorum]